MKLAHSLLELPPVYRLFRRLVAGNADRIYLDTYVKPVADEKLLDIGCGPGNVLSLLPEVKYVGFDINQKYIASAQDRFGDRGRFYCGDVALATVEKEEGTFDLVLATGVVHHLDDEEAAKLFDLAYRALRHGGRMLTFDGCYVPKQPWLARWMLSRDRGRFVRTQEAYMKLAARRFATVTCFLRNDLLRLPYTHLIMQCIK